MYIDTVPNRKSPPAILVRESYREHGKHKKRTLANLSKLPAGAIELLRLYFTGESIRSEHLQHSFDILRTEPYGHIAAVLGSLRNCALEPLLSTKRNRHRDVVTAMIVERIINPGSKLATTHHLTGTVASTLSEQLALGDIDENDLYDAMDWLVKNGDLQPSLFDERDMAEITCESLFPGKRLIVCRNPILAERRHRQCQQLLQATETAVQEIQQASCRDKYRLKGVERISKRGHKALGKHKMAKHFTVDISADGLAWQRDQPNIDEEAALDGFYVNRTNVEAAQLNAAQSVQAYQSLSSVECAFRSFKTVDLKVRPIYHYRGDRARAHLLLCMLAYYVEFHMRRCLAPMLFDDPDGGAPRSSPVLPARPSQAARHKASSKRTPDGLPVHGFHSLLGELSTVAKQQVKPKIAEVPAFEMMTVSNELQEKAFALLNVRLVASTRDCAH